MPEHGWLYWNGEHWKFDPYLRVTGEAIWHLSNCTCAALILFPTFSWKGVWPNRAVDNYINWASIGSAGLVDGTLLPTSPHNDEGEAGVDPRERPQLLVLRRQVLGDRAGLQQELQLGGSVYHPVPGLCSDSSRIWLVLLGWCTAFYGERSHYESFCSYLITASKILWENINLKWTLHDIGNKVL